MATTSAWAVGSAEEVTSLAPRAIILPSFTITAPKGPPFPEVTFSIESLMASRINSFCSVELILLILFKYNKNIDVAWRSF